MTRVEIQKNATQMKPLYIFIAKGLVIKGALTKHIIKFFLTIMNQLYGPRSYIYEK